MALPLVEKNEEVVNVEAGMKNEDKWQRGMVLGGEMVDIKNEVLLEGDEG